MTDIQMQTILSAIEGMRQQFSAFSDVVLFELRRKGIAGPQGPGPCPTGIAGAQGSIRVYGQS
jgi:hypothetical protein